MKPVLPQFIFINGPPSSGKSTTAELLCRDHIEAFRESFAEPIRSMIYAVFFPNDGPIDYQIDLRDGPTKSRPMPFQTHLAGESHKFTVREEMIAFSEKYMKVRYGQDIFGRLLWARCVEQAQWYSSFVIDDSGFVEEATYVISQVGPTSCHLLRLHRPDCSFSGDSRGYITLPGVPTTDLDNSGTPDELALAIRALFPLSALTNL